MDASSHKSTSLFKSLLLTDKSFKGIILMMLAIGLLAYFVTWYLSFRQRMVETAHATQYYQTLEVAHRDRQADNLHEKIKTKMAWLAQANQAMMDMRKTRYLIELKCKYHQSVMPYEQEVARFTARDEVARAFTGSRFVFNDNVQAIALKLTHLDEENKDVCANGAPSDVAYQELQRQIVTLMGESIQIDQEALKKV